MQYREQQPKKLAAQLNATFFSFSSAHVQHDCKKSCGNDTFYSATAPAIIQLCYVCTEQNSHAMEGRKNALRATKRVLFLFITENAKNASSVQKITLWQSYYKNIIGLLCQLAMLCLPQ